MYRHVHARLHSCAHARIHARTHAHACTPTCVQVDTQLYGCRTRGFCSTETGRGQTAAFAAVTYRKYRLIWHACMLASFSSARLPKALATTRFDPSRPTGLIYHSFCILLSFRAATTSARTAWLAEHGSDCVTQCARALGSNLYLG